MRRVRGNGKQLAIVYMIAEYVPNVKYTASCSMKVFNPSNIKIKSSQIF
jgi:collagenase-like PrtC family protease